MGQVHSATSRKVVPATVHVVPSDRIRPIPDPYVHPESLTPIKKLQHHGG
jgi:hypothetical protein